MKILHVISSLQQTGGGTSSAVPTICKIQQGSGLDVEIACRGILPLAHEVEEAMASGVVVHLFKAVQSKLNPASFNWQMLFRLKNIVDSADIVHIHGAWLFPVWWAARCAIKSNKPYVMMPHGSLEPERLKISRWKKRLSGFLFERAAYGGASAVWTTSEAEAESVRRYGVDAPVCIIPIGLNSKDYGCGGKERGFFSKYGLSSDKKTLLYFSRITKVKGLDLLAKSWSVVSRKHSDWQLALAGPSDGHGYIKTAESIFEAECDTRTFRFIGPVYGEAKFALLRSADLFVLPTRNENFSISVAESLSSGVPVVCTKGAPWSVLEGCGRSHAGKCGWWVDVDADAIAGALDEAMSLTSEKLLEMGENGRMWVKENLDWHGIGRRMNEAYQSILGMRR